ncbi:MAG: YicC/YloC family endoribonuclease [Parvularculaceae bacterium]
MKQSKQLPAMGVSSMTGFARAEGVHEERRWIWELRCVNGRGLEMRFRLPAGLEHLEPALRKAAAEFLSRGSLNATLNVERAAGGPTLKVNEAALEEALKLVEKIRSRIDCEKPRAEGVLNIRGVVEQDDGADDPASREAFGAAIVESFRKGADALRAARAAEGKNLSAVLEAQLDDIARLSSDARANSAASPDAIRARIAAQLAELTAGANIPEERLAQEAALIAIKADVREELDRLVAHLAAARALLREKEPVGRRFDFLSQEFNREANTLCSKAQDLSLKRLGLDLKTVIDQLREQVQNIE